LPIRKAAQNICSWCGDRHDPLHTSLRMRPCLRKLVSIFLGLRFPNQAQTRDVPGLRSVKVDKAIMAPQIVSKKGRESAVPAPVAPAEVTAAGGTDAAFIDSVVDGPRTRTARQA